MKGKRVDHDMLCLTVVAQGSAKVCDCIRIEQIRKDEMGRVHATWRTVLADIEQRAVITGRLRAASEIAYCEAGCHRIALGEYADRIPDGPVGYDPGLPLAWTSKR